MPTLLKGTSCLLVLFALGCGSRLKDERTVQLEPGVVKELLIDATSRDQTVHVQVESPGTPVNIYCFLEKDQADVRKALLAHKPSDKILAKEEKKEEVALDVRIPANHNAMVLLTSNSTKPTTAKVKLTN